MKERKVSCFFEENRKTNVFQKRIERLSIQINQWQGESYKIQKMKVKEIRKFIGKPAVVIYKQGKTKGRIKCTLNKIQSANGMDWECKMNPDFKIISGPPKPTPLFVREITMIMEV
ncbi:MAG: hypothetical protein PHG83_03290 [Patescibacteria group bacterium]|nr:hypothetical protein [Patescibacteria group bacterium]